MNCLLEVGLSNAVVATALALVALAVGRMWKNPALTHALWVLVLIKLVTPSFVPWAVVHLPEPEEAVPEAAFDEMPVAHFEVSPQAFAQDSPSFRGSVTGQPSPLLDMPIEAQGEGSNDLTLDTEKPDGDEAVAWVDNVIRQTAHQPAAGGVATAPSPGDVPPVATTVGRPEQSSSPWPLIVVCLWLAGSVGYLFLATSRFRLFQRLLDCAKPAPARIQSRVKRLAGRVGLSRAPKTWLIRAPITPLVWCGLSGTHLVLPTKLIRRLSDQQQATLLTHELAHLRRRDHWVRWLELAATALFWWHPAVW